MGHPSIHPSQVPVLIFAARLKTPICFIFLFFFFNFSGTPLAVAAKEESEIHHTIAELMILANSAVAKKIQRTFPSAALVRVHAPPDPSKLTAFEGVAHKIGVTTSGGAKGAYCGGFGFCWKGGKGGGGGSTLWLFTSGINRVED